MRLRHLAAIATIVLAPAGARADDLNPVFMTTLTHYARLLESKNIEPSGCLYVAQMNMNRFIRKDTAVIPQEAFDRANEKLKTIKLEPSDGLTCPPIANAALVANGAPAAEKH